jgi:TonB-dependent starch-binding outer membrane protein SusC
MNLLSLSVCAWVRAAKTKTFLIMNLTAIFLLAAVIQVSAMGGSAQTVTYVAKSESLAKVFSVIEQQSGYVFFYRKSDLKDLPAISISLKNADVKTALGAALNNQPLNYEIENKTVIISKKNTTGHISTSLYSSVTPPITGIVRGPDGQPIANANVVIKGTKKGTVTNADGTFSIEASNGDVIIISSIGFTDRQLTVNNNTVGVIALALSESKLDEIQIIAYGKTTKRLITGNTASVKASDIEKQPVNNPLLALQGRVPGLQVTQASGISGSGVKVLIQGQNSLNYGNDPFYVIDGVPYVSQLLPNLGRVLGSSKSAGELAETVTGNPLSFINPQDIERIDILKDADATAIYGSRAANGAILITTKKGKIGKTKLDLNLQAGFGKVARKLDLLNTTQYLQMRKEAKKNDNANILNADYDINGTWDTTRFTDWQKELIGHTAEYTDLQANVSGGNGLTQYLIGGNFHKETTVFLGDMKDQKGSLHFNLNSGSQNGKFDISLSGTYLSDANKLMNADLTELAMVIPPNAPSIYKSDGTINWNENSSGLSTVQANYQPATKLLRKYKNTTSNLISNISLSYAITKNLNIKSSFGYTNMEANEILYVDLPSAYPPENRKFINRITQFGDNNINSWIVEPQIDYKRIVGSGEISVLIGSTVQQRNSSRKLLEASGFNSDLVMENINAATSIIVPENSTISSVYKYNAFFGRLNYNFKSKYLVNLTARRDGSSRFGSENHFHNFGAIGAAWLFSSESFIIENFSFISFGKLRGSFGSTGNDQIGDYTFMSLYDNVSSDIPYRGVGGLIPTKIANPSVRWEETKKLQVSLELGFLKDKVLLNATYFHNRSSNQLLSYLLPITTGVASIVTNLPATIQNNGWEFTLTSSNIRTKSFTWSSNLNMTIPRNKLVNYEGLATSAYANQYAIGQPFTIAKRYNFIAVNTSTGAYEFIDRDGKTVQNPTTNFLNRTITVNTSQSLYGGFSNTFSYKSFDLNFLFQFVKQDGQNNFFGNVPGVAFSNQPTTVLDRWEKPGDKKPIQRYNSNFSVAFGVIGARSSNASWADASYIRLKNMSLSWSMPEVIKKSLKTRNIRLYVQGQNLLTFTNYIGLDPETLSSSTLPPLRVITFGINATL